MPAGGGHGQPDENLRWSGQRAGVRLRPVINRFLQAHLFGDIFERDNLDWQSRELATVGAWPRRRAWIAIALAHVGEHARRAERWAVAQI
jgi:hypothetical protein